VREKQRDQERPRHKASPTVSTTSRTPSPRSTCLDIDACTHSRIGQSPALTDVWHACVLQAEQEAAAKKQAEDKALREKWVHPPSTLTLSTLTPSGWCAACWLISCSMCLRVAMFQHHCTDTALHTRTRIISHAHALTRFAHSHAHSLPPSLCLSLTRTPSRYRDRAKERQKGENRDYADHESLLDAYKSAQVAPSIEVGMCLAVCVEHPGDFGGLTLTYVGTATLPQHHRTLRSPRRRSGCGTLKSPSSSVVTSSTLTS
jgi:hypothetical protein